MSEMSVNSTGPGYIGGTISAGVGAAAGFGIAHKQAARSVHIITEDEFVKNLVKKTRNKFRENYAPTLKETVKNAEDKELIKEAQDTYKKLRKEAEEKVKSVAKSEYPKFKEKCAKLAKKFKIERAVGGAIAALVVYTGFKLLFPGKNSEESPKTA